MLVGPLVRCMFDHQSCTCRPHLVLLLMTETFEDSVKMQVHIQYSLPGIRIAAKWHARLLTEQRDQSPSVCNHSVPRKEPA